MNCARVLVVVFGCLLASLGCQTLPRLTVRVQSGLRAGVELRYIRARLLRGSVSCTSSGEVASQGRELAPSDQLALGTGTLTIAELGGLEQGIYTVHVLARRPGAGGPESGAVLIERCVVASVSSDRVIRVPLTTDCIGVDCPAPGGSPAFTECLAGRCVDPRCDPDDPSTAELCCDRTLLGAECDDDPTLCRDSSECTEEGLACSGPPNCEGGVCVEPTEDLCDDGQYCDSTMNLCLSIAPPPADAGPQDGGMDAFVEPSDAFVPPELDAPFSDAPFSDAWAPDAFVSIREDAPFPDVFMPPDAHVAPDAPRPSTDAFQTDAPLPGEDCFVVGDEDGNGSADCADSACMPFCPAGCSPSTPMGRLGDVDIPAPAHWYRGDRVTQMSGVVCAWPDLVGSQHLLGVDRPARPGFAALEFVADAALGVDDSLGMALAGNYTVFLVSQRSGSAATYSRVLSTSYPLSAQRVVETFQNHAATPAYEVRIRGGVYSAGADPSFPAVPSVQTIEVGSLVVGSSASARVSYRRNGASVALTLTSGSDTVTPIIAPTGTPRTILGGAGFEPIFVFELIVYDRVLSAAERGAVEAYLITRYRT